MGSEFVPLPPVSDPDMAGCEVPNSRNWREAPEEEEEVNRR